MHFTSNKNTHFAAVLSGLLALQFLACQPQRDDRHSGLSEVEHAVRPDGAAGVAGHTPADPVQRQLQLDALVAPLLQGEFIGGLAIAIVDIHGEDALHSYGRTRQDGPDVGPDTLFGLASITKLFTALTLADRALDGDVALDEPLAALLPEGTAMPKGGGERITLLDLATHHAGLPQLPDDLPADAPDPYAGYTLQRLLASLGQIRLLAAPGRAYAYSNLGFALLGQGLAQRAGVEYEELVLTRVAAALDMQDTRFELPAALEPRLAQGHSIDEDALPPWHFAAFAPAGGLYSSARDMQRFLRAALSPPDERSAALFDEVLQARRPWPEGAGEIGLGWHIASDGLRWHNGQSSSFASYIALDRERGVGAAVLASTASPWVDVLGERVIELARGNKPDALPLPATIQIDSAALDAYPGQYPLADDFVITVWREEDVLRVRATGQPSFRLWPSADDVFYLRGVEAEIHFERDAAGDVVALVLHQDGDEQRAPRR